MAERLPHGDQKKIKADRGAVNIVEEQVHPLQSTQYTDVSDEVISILRITRIRPRNNVDIIARDYQAQSMEAALPYVVPANLQRPAV